MCLQQDLRDQGIDPEKLPRFSDRSMTRNYHALQAGDIDVMQAFEPFVSMAEQDKAGDVLYAASTRGPTAYTAFIANARNLHGIRWRLRRDDARDRQDADVALCQSRLGAGHRGDDVLPRRAEGHPCALAATATNRPACGHAETRMIPQGFERLAQSLHSGGFIARMPSYDDCVQPTLNRI